MKYSRFRLSTVKNSLSLLLVAALYFALAGRASAITLRPGDILVADPDFVHANLDDGTHDITAMQPSVSRVDPVTGIRDIVTSKTKGGGAPLLSATQVVVDSLGRITVADPFSDALLRVDPATGNRTNLFSSFDPNQPDIATITGIALDSDNSIVVLDHLSHTILRTDPVTGFRTLISGPTRGSGPGIDFGGGVSVDPSGNIYATVSNAAAESAIFKIDPLTGDRSIVSGWGRGAGEDFFSDIRDVQVVDDHTAIAINLLNIFQVDLATGNREVVASLYPQDPRIESLSSIARLPDGRFVLTDEYEGKVYTLDLNSGVPSLLSGNTAEFGQRLSMLQDAFVIGVPEPGACALLATMAGGSAFGLRRRPTRR